MKKKMKKETAVPQCLFINKNKNERSNRCFDPSYTGYGAQRQGYGAQRQGYGAQRQTNVDLYRQLAFLESFARSRLAHTRPSRAQRRLHFN